MADSHVTESCETKHLFGAMFASRIRYCGNIVMLYTNPNVMVASHSA